MRPQSRNARLPLQGSVSAVVFTVRVLLVVATGQAARIAAVPVETARGRRTVPR